MKNILMSQSSLPPVFPRLKSNPTPSHPTVLKKTEKEESSNPNKYFTHADRGNPPPAAAVNYLSKPLPEARRSLVLISTSGLIL